MCVPVVRGEPCKYTGSAGGGGWTAVSCNLCGTITGVTFKQNEAQYSYHLVVEDIEAGALAVLEISEGTAMSC